MAAKRIINSMRLFVGCAYLAAGGYVLFLEFVHEIPLRYVIALGRITALVGGILLVSFGGMLIGKVINSVRRRSD